MDVDDIDKFIDTVKRIGVKVLYIGGEFFQAIHLSDNFIFCARDLSIPGIAEKIRAVQKKQKQSL
jgi:hypothetical protein